MDVDFQVVLATFTTYIMSSTDHVLDAHKIFVTLALINVMTVPLTALPRTIVLAVQVRGLHNRITQVQYSGVILS